MLNLDLVDQAARALARLQTPDFLHVDDEFVFNVFSRAFNEGDIWFEEFKQTVATLSGGTVAMNEVQAQEYPGARVKGSVRYFALIRDGVKIYGHFGPYVPPFSLCLPVS